MSISVAVSTLRPTLERLAGFAALTPDWDSYGGLPSSPRAVSTATELLILVAGHLPRIAPDRIVPYAVAPIADGGVQLEWRGPRDQIEVEVGPQGEIGYLLVERRPDRRYEERSRVSRQQVLQLVTHVISGDLAP